MTTRDPLANKKNLTSLDNRKIAVGALLIIGVIFAYQAIRGPDREPYRFAHARSACESIVRERFSIPNEVRTDESWTSRSVLKSQFGSDLDVPEAKLSFRIVHDGGQLGERGDCNFSWLDPDEEAPTLVGVELGDYWWTIYD